MVLDERRRVCGEGRLCAFPLTVLPAQLLYTQLQNAIEASLNYDKCLAHKGDARLSCQLDKAMTNLGTLLANQVEGRVCTEIDPRLANDAGACVLNATLNH